MRPFPASRLSVKKFSDFLYRFGPLAPVVAFFLAGLFVFSLSRLGLFALYSERLLAVEHSWWLFPIGLRMDTILLSMVSLPPALLLLTLPRWGERIWRPLLALWFSASFTLFVYMEVATVPFLEQYDNRPNRLFVEYLVYPREVFGMLWADYKVELLLAAVLLVVAWRGAWRTSQHLLLEHRPWPWWLRLVMVPVVTVLLFLGGRSSLGHRAANPSTAAFSNENLANELALNSTYSLAFAVHRMSHEGMAVERYGAMDFEEALERVQRYAGMSPTAYTDPRLPTLHRQQPPEPRQRPYNLVIFVQESMGAEYVGALGGKPLTPNLDRLSREGLFLTDLYATGTRTVRGMEAVVTGFLPTPGRSVVKLGLSQHGFFTLAELLKRNGYTTEFIYGGESHFDNMGGFFLGNGFDRVIDQPQFDDAVFEGVWGVSDEDLVHRAHQAFVEHGDKPFFALMLSTSNHTPFDFPEGRIELYEKPAATVNNAIKYADYAIGELFRLAKGADYFDNTIFLVVADHNTRTWGNDLVPVDKFHIPGLIIGPGVPARSYDKLASQIDLPATLLSLMGLEAAHPMVGRDLLALPEDVPGRAMMQFYKTNALRVGDRVVVHQPDKPPRQFRYEDKRLHPMALDPELVRDALAHIHLPAHLYLDRMYRLPD